MYQNSFNLNNFFMNFEPIGVDNIYLFDKNNKKVLDLSSNLLFGYNNFIIEKAIITTLHSGILNTSTNILNEHKKELNHKLCKLAGFYHINNKEETITGTTIFCNCREQAIENAIKIARIRYNVLCDRNYSEIICFENCNHGNSIASESILQKQTNFEPLLNGFKIAQFNNIKSVEKLITENTSAIMIEPIQFDTGIKIANIEFLQKLKQLCNNHEILLIFDETISFCRNGALFNYKKYNIIPDIICIGDTLTNGINFGTCIVNEECIKYSNTDYNTSCRNDNHMCFNIANSIINYIVDNDIEYDVNLKNEFIANQLTEILQKYPNIINDVNNFGLMFSLKLHDYIKNNQFAKILFSNNLLVKCVNDNNILLFIPLTLTIEHLKKVFNTIKISIEEISILEKY